MSSFLFIVLILIGYCSITASAGRKRFIMRFDDVQDWYVSTTQIEIFEFFWANNISVSAGIIGNYVNGSDPNLFAVLKKCAGMSRFKCDFFNHGMDARFIFGESPSAQTSKNQILACENKIQTLFPGYFTEIMIPHQNSWNPYMLEAINEVGILGTGASIWSYSNMTWNLSSRPIQMPQQTATAGYIGENDWVAVPKNISIFQCEEADALGQDCVIMMHPMEFASGNYTLAMLQDLVLTLVHQGWTSINFHTVVTEVFGTNVGRPTAMPTIKPVDSNNDSSDNSTVIKGTLLIALLSISIALGLAFLLLVRYACSRDNKWDDIDDEEEEAEDLSV